MTTAMHVTVTAKTGTYCSQRRQPHLAAGTPMIRAKAVSEKEVDSGNDIYGNPIKRIQYEIKQIKSEDRPFKQDYPEITWPSSWLRTALLPGQ
ncbi:hypothetical protein A6R68_12039, partial [Neotoma lepida]